MRRPRRVSRHLARQPFRHPPYRALSSSRTRQVHSPSRTIRRATTWFPPRRALCPAGAGSLPRLGGLPGRRGTPPSARYREYGVRCLAMRRRPSTAAALQRGTRSALSVLPSRRALRPGNVACGDSDCGTPYHRVITRAPKILLARPLARLAARPHLRPVTTAIALPGDRPPEALSASSGRRSGSDGRCATARIIVSVARVTAMSGPPGFAARTATMRPWAAGSSGSTYAKSPAAASGASAMLPTRSTNVFRAEHRARLLPDHLAGGHLVEAAEKIGSLIASAMTEKK